MRGGGVSLTVIMTVLFAGILLFMHGYYRHRLQLHTRATRVEYRFVPRTFYEDQFFGDRPSDLFRAMFQKESPWPKGVDSLNDEP
jgi:hypothetical protein